MELRGILIGERNRRYKDRDVYRVDYVEDVEYSIKDGHSSIVSVNTRDVSKELDKCLKDILRYGSGGKSFVIADYSLNRIGGDHCIRIASREDKYTAGLDIMGRDLMSVKYDLMDYGIARGYELESVDTEVKDLLGLQYDVIDDVLECSTDTNMKDAWIEDNSIMIELHNRELLTDGSYTVTFLEDNNVCGLHNAWYRLKCISSICNIPSRVIGGIACYFAGTQKGYPILVSKEFLDNTVSRIRYIVIDMGKNSQLICYDCVAQKVTTVSKKKAELLSSKGELVYTLESSQVDMNHKARLEYVPLPDGKFVNSEGNIITHKEMEEYYLQQYGYFIDLYNSYKMHQKGFKWNKINNLKYTKINGNSQYWIGQLSYTPMNVIRTQGIIGDTYTEFIGLKIENQLILKGSIKTLLGTSKNKVEIRNKRLIQCKLASSIVLRDTDIKEIECLIENCTDEEVTVEIQGNTKIKKCGANGKIIFVTNNYETLKRLYTNLISQVIVYNGSEYDEVVYNMLMCMWNDRDKSLVRRNEVRIQGFECLSYKHTYEGISKIVKETRRLFMDRKKQNVELKPFIQRLIGYGMCGYEVNRDAIRDIVIDCDMGVAIWRVI